MKYEVWVEGYACTGQSDKATKVGEVEADSFQAACDELCAERYGKYYRDGAVWGCRLFDNEADARRAFG